MHNIAFLAQRAKLAAAKLSLLSTEAKDEILEKIARGLEEHMTDILKANKKDIAAAKKNKLSASLIDRMLLNEERIKGIAADIRNVETLEDSIGKTLESRQLENGLFLKRVRVPLGVIGMIYEARPNVTVDAAVLCLKSGNAVLLKGGSDCMHSNRALIKIIREVLAEASGFQDNHELTDAVQLIDTVDRAALKELLTLHDSVDVIIPRGSAGLIDFVRENATVPVIETGASVVHTYVDEAADIQKAAAILLNAKLRRVSICNTLDTALLHQSVAEKFLPAFVKGLAGNPYKADHLEIRADETCYAILKKYAAPKGFTLTLRRAVEKDYDTEFLDYILAVKTVRHLDEAIEHIGHHGLKHSEAIITEKRATAERFLQEVDAACVYWNTSTQFSDGAQFGLGAEIGISTQKLHVRGPFALEGLTSYKWIIEGDGQIRK